MTAKINSLKDDIIETGSEISGGVAGAVIGTLIAGAPGAIIGGAGGPIVTRVFKKVAADIQKRFLSPREEIRIDAVFGFTINRIQENLKEGKLLRSDSFFTFNENERADSEEIFEGIILGAQKEYEERKVKFLGNLYGNICTNTNISKEHANQLIKTTNTLSYRQLCILELMQEKLLESEKLDFRIKLDIPFIEVGDVIVEIRDLQVKGLLNITTRWRETDDNSTPIRLDEINITKVGRFFCEMLNLKEIPKDELDKFKNLLKIQVEK